MAFKPPALTVVNAIALTAIEIAALCEDRLREVRQRARRRGRRRHEPAESDSNDHRGENVL